MSDVPIDTPPVIADPPESESAPKETPPPPADSLPLAEPLESAAPEQPKVGKSPEMVATLKDVRGETIAIANEMNISFGASSASIRVFSSSDTGYVPSETEHEIEELFVADPKEIDDLIGRVSETRILLLTGDEGIGKATTAIYIAKRLADANAFIEPVRVVDPLDRDVKVDLRALASDGATFGSRALIFRDVLSRDNRDLLSFFTHIDRIGCAELRDRLEQTKAFLIFTASSRDAAPLRRQIDDRELCYEMSAPSALLISDWLQKKLRIIQERLKLDTAAVECLRTNELLLCEELKTIPRISRFIDYYLLRPDIDLESSIRRFKDVGYWFSDELSGDFDAWSFTLSLALAQAMPEGGGIPWLLFDRFRRTIRRALRSDDDLFSVPDSDDVHHQRMSGVSDPVLLEHCRAEVGRDPRWLTDVVRFKDANHATELWRVLLGNQRRLLVTLLAPLRKLAERHDDAEQRALAARAIGRIGKIDPHRITLWLLQSWSDSRQAQRLVSVGHLFQGVISDVDADYRELCLRKLRALTDSNGISDISDEDSEVRILTAIVAWALIGKCNPTLALLELGGIATTYVAPMLRDVQHIARVQKRIERAVRETLKSEERDDLFVDYGLLELIAHAIYGRKWTSLVRIQCAVTSIAIDGDPVQVFNQMRDWASRGGATTGLLTAFMFLQEGGIAAELERVRIQVSGPATSVSTLVASFSSTAEAVTQMAAFLGDLYESVLAPFTLQPESQQYFRGSLLRHLTTWTRDALAVASCRSAMVELLTELSRIRGGRFFQIIYQLIDGVDFRSDDMQKFANDVRRRMLE